jgi:hypothetical protein
MANLISFFLGWPWMSMLRCQNVMKMLKLYAEYQFPFLNVLVGQSAGVFLCSFVAYYAGFVFDSFYYGF